MEMKFSYLGLLGSIKDRYSCFFKKKNQDILSNNTGDIRDLDSPLIG